MLSSTHQMTLVLTGITWLARTTLAAVGCDATEFIDRNQCARTKQQIEAGFTSILDQCKPTRLCSLPNSLYLSVQDHLDKDCHTAYNSIPVDKKSRLLGEDGQPTAVVEKTFKTCTVLIKTTDNSTSSVPERDRFSGIEDDQGL
ncbi:hypothetical protein KEM48_001461 [Puccinia striiformis f. sp. tritici PST-130]|nr:hypothetical protein KEM48_001461 [Puccinia striiformis f. sp. tritici PST-130]